MSACAHRHLACIRRSNGTHRLRAAPALSLVVTIAFLAWSVTILSYISFHHHRLGKLITAASDEGDPEKTVVSDVVDSGEDTQAVLAML